MHAHEVYICESHTYKVHALEMHVRKVLGSPTLQTVVRWSICRDLSCKIRVLALRDKRSLFPSAPVPPKLRQERNHTVMFPRALRTCGRLFSLVCKRTQIV